MKRCYWNSIYWMLWFEWECPLPAARRFVYLNAWFLVCEGIWEELGELALLEEVYHRFWGFKNSCRAKSLSLSQKETLSLSLSLTLSFCLCLSPLSVSLFSLSALCFCLRCQLSVHCSSTMPACLFPCSLPWWSWSLTLWNRKPQ